MPYQIDPGTNPGGEEFEAYNRRRWGGSGWTRRLIEEGRRDGANFADWRWWPSTLKAHQLVRYAEERGGVPTSDSNRALFEAAYELGENISSVDALVRVGTEGLGLGGDAAAGLQPYLEADGGADAVLADIREGRRRYGIRSVPFFVIDAEGRDAPPYGLSGAQGTATFLSHFEAVAFDDDDDDDDDE